MDINTRIGSLMQHFKFVDQDFTYFEFDLKTCFDMDGVDQVDEIEVNNEKYQVQTIQKGSADYGYYGEIAICLDFDANLWLTAQWCE